MVGVKNMSKYDKMIALNKKASDEKVGTAKKAIHKMIDEGEKVTIPKLMQNMIVRREIDRAMEQQAGMVDPKRFIGDMALKSRIELLEEQNRELRRTVGELEKDKKRLEKALNRKDLELLKNF